MILLWFLSWMYSSSLAQCNVTKKNPETQDAFKSEDAFEKQEFVKPETGKIPLTMTEWLYAYAFAIMVVVLISIFLR